jgi:serine/threonine protein kinase
LGNETLKTIDLQKSDFLPLMRYSKYFHEFNESKIISFGGFGIVAKAMNIKDKIFYAIKKISIKRNEIQTVRRELGIMEKLKSHCIVEYKWIVREMFVA